MKDLDYYKEVSRLTDELKSWEKEINELALGVDEEFSAEEAKKISLWLFKLWEAVAHYKGRLYRVGKLESQRFEEMLEERGSEMKAYVLFQDIPYEFGQIHGIYKTRKAGEIALSEIVSREIDEGWVKNAEEWYEKYEEQYSIDEWEVEE